MALKWMARYHSRRRTLYRRRRTRRYHPTTRRRRTYRARSNRSRWGYRATGDPHRQRFRRRRLRRHLFRQKTLATTIHTNRSFIHQVMINKQTTDTDFETNDIGCLKVTQCLFNERGFHNYTALPHIANGPEKKVWDSYDMHRLCWIRITLSNVSILSWNKQYTSRATIPTILTDPSQHLGSSASPMNKLYFDHDRMNFRTTVYMHSVLDRPSFTLRPGQKKVLFFPVHYVPKSNYKDLTKGYNTTAESYTVDTLLGHFKSPNYMGTLYVASFIPSESVVDYRFQITVTSKWFHYQAGVSHAEKTGKTSSE